MARSWTDEQLIEAVQTSEGITAIVLKLYKGFAGSHFEAVRKHVDRLGLKIKPARRKSKVFSIPDDELFTERSSIHPRRIKARLSEIETPKCEECGNEGQWRGKKLVIQMDHRNGDNRDNRLHNLRWLCPNCHTQTPGYSRAKSRMVSAEPRPLKSIKIMCGYCHTDFQMEERRHKNKTLRGQTVFYCGHDCSVKVQIGKPGIVDLNERRTRILERYSTTQNYSQVGREFGVSEAAIRKLVKRHTPESSSGKKGSSDPPNARSNRASGTNQTEKSA